MRRSSELPRETLVNKRDGLVDPVKRDESAKARPLARTKQHLVKRLEPIAQRVKPLPSASKNKALQLFGVRRPFPGNKARAQRLKRLALQIGGRTVGFRRLNEVIIIPDRIPRRRIQIGMRLRARLRRIAADKAPKL